MHSNGHAAVIYHAALDADPLTSQDSSVLVLVLPIRIQFAVDGHSLCGLPFGSLLPLLAGN